MNSLHVFGSYKKNMLLSALTCFLAAPIVSMKAKDDVDYAFWAFAGCSLAAIAGITGYAIYAESKYYERLAAEPIDNIQHYLQEVQLAIRRVETEEHIAAWLAGGEWQNWFLNQVASLKRSDQALQLLSQLDQANNQLNTHEVKDYLKRLAFLTQKYHAYEDQQRSLKLRIDKLEHIVRQMKDIIRQKYEKLDAEETCIRMYNDLQQTIQKLQNDDVFIIDINTIKSLAYSSYHGSAWPYLDMIARLDQLKQELVALRSALQNAPAHEKKAQYTDIANEFYRRVVWAIDFITKDPEYANQYNRKVQYDIERFGR